MNDLYYCNKVNKPTYELFIMIPKHSNQIIEVI